MIYANVLYANYLFYDYNLVNIPGKLPNDFKVSTDGNSTVVRKYRVEGETDCCYAFESKGGSKSTVSVGYDADYGNVAFELKYLPLNMDGRFEVSLCKAEKETVAVYDEGTELCNSVAGLLRKHHKNVWQTLRLVTDAEKGFCAIYFNVKLTNRVQMSENNQLTYNFKLTYSSRSDSEVLFSDIKLWQIPEKCGDYVPKPVIPKKKHDIVVGINVCSLWREGSHCGWDSISPYDDIKPVLGYYDEGIPEESDWEIKFRAEHGIDYALYCWYSSESSAPIKSTPYSSAILDGYFYAEYSEMEKFAFIWEAANGQHPHGIEDFKNNPVPYWLDYFFSDKRYMSVNNVAIMSCFGENNVEKDLGGEEKVREALDYLRNEVKKLGYDDLVVMGTFPDIERQKRLGFDAFHAYHWDWDGYKLETSIEGNRKLMEKQIMPIVPTMSVGFNHVGWSGERFPMLMSDDMEKGIDYCLRNFLPTYRNDPVFSKLIHLSTWNEYGEGTYMMPSGLNGFGYLDAVRNAVCEDGTHTDVVPDERQKSRICHLHVQSRHLLKRQGYDKRPVPETESIARVFEFESQSDLDKWEFRNMKNVRIENGVLKDEATENLPEMELKDVCWDASEISYLKVNFTNMMYENGQPQNIYVVPSNCPDKSNYNLQNSAHIWCNRLYLTEYRALDLDTHSWWQGTIYGLKIVPVVYGTFEIKSVTFYKALPHLTMYGKDKRPLFFGDYLQEHGRDVYVPLDPESGIYSSLDIRRYEWFKDEGRLELKCGKDRLTVYSGKMYVMKNKCSIMLSHPVIMKDAVPTLLLDDLCRVFDVGFKRCLNNIYLI